jgi:tRNA A37 threonylcarbamoyltransferase TsaD
MKKYGNCDFSYAGLKTSVRLCIERELGSADGVGKRATNANVASSNSSGSSSSGSNRDAAGQPSQQLEQQRGDPQQPPPEQQQQQQEQQQQIKANVAASFQRVAVAHLVMRLKRAIEWAREEEPSCQHLVVAGGVASNQYVRQQVTQVRMSGFGCRGVFFSLPRE